MITWRLIRFACALSVMVAGASSAQSGNPEVALAPFAVAGARAGDLRPTADECLERLAAALAAKSVKVSRLASLDEKTLARARPARWAVLGRLERVNDSVRAELRLMEVATGDEMRSYFNTSSDPKEIVALGARAAERIAVFVGEKRSGAGGRDDHQAAR
jgi:hypothetical protein